MNVARGVPLNSLLLYSNWPRIMAVRHAPLFYIKGVWATSALLLLACFTTPSAYVQAGGFVFDKIADTSTIAPGGINPFVSFGNRAPAIEDDQVVIYGFSLGIGGGIYTRTKHTGLQKVADGNDPPFSFNPFSPPSLDDGEIAFYSSGFSEVHGIYTTDGGVHKRYGTSTPTPNAPGTFTGFSFEGASLSKGNVAFKARNGFNYGIYTDLGGPLRLVADETTSVSDSDVFSSLDDPVIEDNGIFFSARTESGKRGVYSDIDSVLTTIVDSNTVMPVPGGSTFSSFANIAIDDGLLAFVATGSGNGWGIFTYSLAGGQAERIVDGSFARPEGNGNFGLLQQLSISNNQVAFKSVGHGLYTNLSGSLTRVLGIGETLDGKIVSDVRMGREGLSNSKIALIANFEDGSSGIFVATHVPEPTSIALAFVLLTLIGIRHRR